MDEESSYQGVETPAGRFGYAAGAIYFAVAATVPVAVPGIETDCLQCRDEWIDWAVILAIILSMATGFGFAARAICKWLQRRHRLGEQAEAPVLAISSATILFIFLGIWLGAVLRG